MFFNVSGLAVTKHTRGASVFELALFVCVCVCLCVCVCVCVQSMEEILHCYSKEENPELNRQIEFIIKQLNSGQSTG